MFRLSSRLWFEALLTLLSTISLAATLVWPQWIEVLSRSSPIAVTAAPSADLRSLLLRQPLRHSLQRSVTCAACSSENG